MDHTAKLWDATSGALRATLEGHADTLEAASFSPDGRTVVTASNDHTAKLWDATTGALRATLDSHWLDVTCASFSPDGRMVVTASEDGTAKLWDTATGALRATLEPEHVAGGVYAAGFSPDGRTVVTAGSDRTAKLWDATTGALRATLEGHSHWVLAATFSPDGQTVATASADHTAKLWDSTTGALRATLQSHRDRVWAATFSPDGRMVVTASEDRTAKLWDARTSALRAALESHRRGRRVSFSPDGRTVVTWRFLGNPTAKLYDARTGVLRASLQGHANGLSAATFSADGRMVVTASFDGTAKLWDSTTGALRSTLEGHANGLGTAEFSPDGRTVVTGSGDRTAKLWDATTGALRSTLEGHSEFVSLARFSPEGRIVVTASWDGTAKLWDATTGALRSTLQAHSGIVWDASFDPDGGMLVTAGKDATAKVWDATNGALRATLQGHSGDVWAASFSPDGGMVVTASGDHTAKLWDATTGALRATLAGHRGSVHSASFSRDGRFVLTGSEDGTAKLWDATQGTLRQTFQGHIGAVFDHRLESTSRTLTIAGRSGSIEHFRYDTNYRITDQYAIHTFDRPDGTYATLYSTPDGLFTGDEDAFSRVIYRLGPDILHDDLVTADQLFERFHRSTLVEDFWAGRPLALPSGLETGVGRPPSVELIDVPSRQQGASQQELTLRVRATDRGGGVGELRVFVNGARADVLETVTRAGDAAATRSSTEPSRSGERGLRLRARTAGGPERTSEVRSRSGLYGPGEHELRVLLAPGDNVITVEGYSVLGEVRGERAQATVRLEGVPEVAPRLFVVAVSASDYADDTLNLRYANADATAMVRALERQAGSGKLFAESIVVRLSDADATRAKVLEALARVKREARPEDAVVFYVASHGMVHRCGATNDERYQLLLAGTRRADVCADALDTAQLTRAMAGIPAQEKLLLLDTCQSGGAVDEGSLAALRGELRDEGLRAARAAGVAVISGSAASQSSYEVAELGQGLFTFALLRGLEGRAALGGIERGGRIGVANLVRYVSRQLPILAERYANARQTPTYGAMGNDFTVAIARPDDPPLLAMTSLPPAVRDAERTANRGLDAPDGDGVNAQLDRHVRAHANELEACTHGRVTEVVARWGVDGQVRFALSGAGAGTDDEACARRALGTLQVEDAEHRVGEMRLVATP